ncbi:hypothetical protein LTR56_023835 [Elasticomyces elasticus]|nr:hypothetical protein LTR56_023835 [Elasticomyces elasticus]KAK3624430.1 hypothetical protein LTR22_023963 [Elasticomyces elasticus]KAK4906408.1 hypothetical protein LTR49_024430 [Elasticomyces elasticus]KAK5747341.1 hypothetical protein LTS12_022396 [Elasticomyces elasticus]
MSLSKKRGSSPEEVYEEWTEPKPKKARVSKKAAAKDIGTCSMNKKEIGDEVKSCLVIEKYSISSSRINVRLLQQASGEQRSMLITLLKLTMDMAFFRSFFVSNPALTKPIDVQPASFDEETAVVVAEIGNAAAGELLGVSKVKGGNRMMTTYLRSMCVVFYPKDQKCQLWLTV